MKNKNIFLAIVAAVMTIASCAKIESTFTNRIPTNSKGEYAILFDNRTLETKATVTTTAGNGYDEFSLFGWNTLNDTIMNPFTVQANGANSYVYEDVNGQKLQYFKNNADSYSFIGIIPTTNVKVKNGVVKVGVESFVVDDNRVSGTLTADSPKEFLWARTDVAKANYGSGNVNLPFKHGNALLYLGFISDDNNTKIIDYTPYTPSTPGTAAVPGTTTTTTKTGKALDMLYAGEIVYWPYAADGTLTSTQANNFFKAESNYGNIGILMDAVNTQFVYYDDLGTVTTKAWIEGNKKDKYGIQLATTTNKDDFIGGTTEDTWKDAFWKNASTQIKDTFRKSYEAGWRVVRIENISGNHYDAWLMNNTEMTYKVITTTGGSPAVPAVPESGFKGIRVFSADSTAAGFVHVAHTKTADATVATALTFDNRVAVTDSILFSLPGVVVPAGTTEAQAVYSPTTFYAIPGDEGLTHFVVKLSYTYKGTTVYDVRVPIALPTGGLEAGKYYKYIINITSTANGTNNQDEANDEKDDIDITNNPIQATINVTDYAEGHTQIVKI